MPIERRTSARHREFRCTFENFRILDEAPCRIVITKTVVVQIKPGYTVPQIRADPTHTQSVLRAKDSQQRLLPFQIDPTDPAHAQFQPDNPLIVFNSTVDFAQIRIRKPCNVVSLLTLANPADLSFGRIEYPLFSRTGNIEMGIVDAQHHHLPALRVQRIYAGIGGSP